MEWEADCSIHRCQVFRRPSRSDSSAAPRMQLGAEVVVGVPVAAVAAVGMMAAAVGPQVSCIHVRLPMRLLWLITGSHGSACTASIADPGTIGCYRRVGGCPDCGWP